MLIDANVAFVRTELHPVVGLEANIGQERWSVPFRRFYMLHQCFHQAMTKWGSHGTAWMRVLLRPEELAEPLFLSLQVGWQSNYS